MASLTSLVSKMDSAFGNGKQLGENAHVEYTWSKSLEELFVQYYFQLVRTKDHSDLIKKFTYMIENIPKHHKLFPYLYKLWLDLMVCHMIHISLPLNKIVISSLFINLVPYLY